MSGRALPNAKLVWSIPGNDIHIVEDQDRHGEPCLMDSDGNHIMDVPPLLLAQFDGEAQMTLDSILVDMAFTHREEVRAAHDRGERAGVANTQAFLQQLLGTDRIGDELDRLTDAVIMLNESLWRISK